MDETVNWPDCVSMRLAFSFILFLTGFAISANEPANFAKQLLQDMRGMLSEAAQIDPATGEEHSESRKTLIARQRVLQAWFRGKGQAVSLADCKTPEDKANYREFRDTMATYEFVRLKLRERKRFISRVDSYLATLAGDFDASLKRFFVVESESDPLWQALRARLQPVQLKPRYFGHGRYTGTAAVYYPPERTVYLNLNMAVESPDDFIDSLEHELWHHFMPLVTANTLHENLWWEGFTEAAAEQWADGRLGQERGRGASVEYPVQVAFASLFVGLDRRLTLEHAYGLKSREEFLEEFAAKPDQSALRNALANALGKSMQVNAARKETLERMLRHWGWKEDDRSPFKLDVWLEGEALSEAKIRRSFRWDKQLLLDIIQAQTVANLQAIKSAVGERAGQSLPLPKSLSDNLRRVMDYVDAPYHQYANR
ncbi:MAG: hypothetical protein ACI8W8_001584 [Rhodothermales bacterium]|jgi:hypothetical protein